MDDNNFLNLDMEIIIFFKEISIFLNQSEKLLKNLSINLDFDEFNKKIGEFMIIEERMNKIIEKLNIFKEILTDFQMPCNVSNLITFVNVIKTSKLLEYITKKEFLKVKEVILNIGESFKSKNIVHDLEKINKDLEKLKIGFVLSSSKKIIKQNYKETMTMLIVEINKINIKNFNSDNIKKISFFDKNYWDNRKKVLQNLIKEGGNFERMLKYLFALNKQFIVTDQENNVAKIITESANFEELKRKIKKFDSDNEIFENIISSLKNALTNLESDFDDPNSFWKNSIIPKGQLEYFNQGSNANLNPNQILELKEIKNNSNWKIEDLIKELKNLKIVFNGDSLFKILENNKNMEIMFNILNNLLKKLLILMIGMVNSECVLLNIEGKEQFFNFFLKNFKEVNEKGIIKIEKLNTVLNQHEELTNTSQIEVKIKEIIEEFKSTNLIKLKFEDIIGNGNDNLFEKTHKKYDSIKEIEKTEISKTLNAKEILDKNKLKDELDKIKELMGDLDKYNLFLFKKISIGDFVIDRYFSLFKNVNVVNAILNKLKFSYWIILYSKLIFDNLKKNNAEEINEYEDLKSFYNEKYERKLDELKGLKTDIEELKKFNGFMKRYGKYNKYFENKYQLFIKNYENYSVDDIKELNTKFVEFLKNVNDYYLKIGKIMKILKKLHNINI